MEKGSDSSSNGSNSHTMLSISPDEFINKPDGNLEKLLLDAEYDYSDAQIVADGVPVGVNRCILALRSQFFHDLFKRPKDRAPLQEGKEKYVLSDLVPHGKIIYEPFMDVLNYLYSGKLRPSPTEVATCVDDTCSHDACLPAISYTVDLMYAAATFQIKDLVAIVEHRLLNFVDKAVAEDVIPIIEVAFNYHLNRVLPRCIKRLAQSNIDDISLEKELPDEVLCSIKSFRTHQEVDHEAISVEFLYGKKVQAIYKAMDSSKVELLKSLLDEFPVTLDDVNALHYAAAYCDPKVVNEVLGMGKADLNLRNSQGYTALHVASRRKNPSIIMELLNHGASVWQKTLDGQTSNIICRRMTRSLDYKKVQGTNTDWCCIDLLEKEMCRNPFPETMLKSSEMEADNLRMRFLFLKNLVSLAQLLFPMEAKVAMDIAQADLATELSGRSLHMREFDLNETPSQLVERLQLQLKPLGKIVEIGRRLFPSCCEVLDKIFEDVDLLLEDQARGETIQKTRFLELKEKVAKAFATDKTQIYQISSSSSSLSETDTLLLERARKLLRGNCHSRITQCRGPEQAMKEFDKDRAENNWISFSASSSFYISSLCGEKKNVRKRQLC
ncbi:hypothetical protein ACH5RR_036961 [Cinchona calisaya]|uniref:Uncharacterized protein n=1 Tax=Cinchona calisaya TaxID=153742 RepID=A0ABD2Y4Q7_9GENT